MPRNSTTIEVFIASPSDVAAERDVVERVINHWNAAHSRATGVSLQAVRWETHAHPEMGGRPQGLINRQIVDDADILIGVFWTRFGTETGEAPSGTAEEIERFRCAGKKVLVYFSNQGPSLDRFDPKEYQRLLEYKESLKPGGLYGTYKSLDDLREQLTVHLAQVVNELHPTAPKMVPLAPGPDLSAQRAAMSRGPLKAILAIEAKWEAEKTSAYVQPDNGKQWMGEVTEILAQVVTSSVVRGNDAIATQLKEILRTARDIVHWPITFDSLSAFWDEGTALLEQAKGVLEEIGDTSERGPTMKGDVPSALDPALYPKLTARLSGAFHDSEQRHAVFTIELKNQSSSVTFEDISTKVEVENPAQPGDWREFHPLRWPMAWDDLPPRPDERYKRGFTFPSSEEIQSRPFEDFLRETFEPLFRDLTLPHPANGSMKHTYYEAIEPFTLRIRFTVEYLPALDGAPRNRLVQYYTLSPLCEARDNRIHEPKHPNIITGWKLSRDEGVPDGHEG